MFKLWFVVDYYMNFGINDFIFENVFFFINVGMCDGIIEDILLFLFKLL